MILHGQEFHGQRSLAGSSPWGHKELYATEQFSLFFNATILSHVKELKLYLEGKGKLQMTSRNMCVGPDHLCPLDKDELKGGNIRQGQ